MISCFSPVSSRASGAKEGEDHCGGDRGREGGVSGGGRGHGAH